MRRIEAAKTDHHKVIEMQKLFQLMQEHMQTMASMMPAPSPPPEPAKP